MDTGFKKVISKINSKREVYSCIMISADMEDYLLRKKLKERMTILDTATPING